MQLTVGQQEFLNMVAAGENIFLTGNAGTGKSHVVKQAIDLLVGMGKKVIAAAPTGIAANNIDGQTIHSLFKLNPYGILDYEECRFLTGGNRDVLRRAEVIVFDEVSMLRPDILDAVHWTLKKNGLDGLDARQIIFVGDMAQLPPILDDNERTVLYRTYDGETFEYARIYRKLNVKTVELKEVVRQTDVDFINALNVVRSGGRDEYFKQFVHAHPNGIILAPHNTTVRLYNNLGLRQQPGEEFVFTAKIDGMAKPQDFHLEQEIRVKNGCKVMYLVNSKDNPLRNGTLGMFVSHNGCYYIRVGEIDYALAPVVIAKKKYVYNSEEDKIELQEVGSIEQYPIKLAYALTIHKAQGLTFDEVTVDLRQPCFQKGQMYVALSRVTGPAGLRIITN